MVKFFLSSTTLFVIASSYFYSSVDAQTCKTLCGSQNQQIAVQSCADQTLSSTPFSPCCDNGDSRAFCDGQRKCRSVAFNGITGCSDPGQGELHCINPAITIFMSVDIRTESRPGVCCAECSCSGDPHCYAFNHKADDFILCDARDVSKNCDVTKPLCDTQLDETGAQCVFSNGMCMQAPTSPIPTMLFYQKDNVAIRLTLGDRGITTAISVKQGDNELSLTADDCQNFPNNPWVGTPIGILKSEHNGRIWKYLMPLIKSQLTVHCLPTGTLVPIPRLDVSIIDVASTPGGVPSGVSGFCGTGIIGKGKATTDITDAIRIGNLCRNEPLAVTASYFNNNKPVASVSKAVNKFCKKYMGDVPNTATTGVKACIENITGKDGVGWAKVFCTANTVVTKDLNECDATSDCIKCQNDVVDFGWPYAIEQWDITKSNGPKPGATCIKISDLPFDLLECQRGILIQYFLDGQWNTYRAIPSGYTLCESSGAFNSVDDSVLFQNNIRFNECGSALLPPGTCPDQLNEFCDAEDGFVVTLNTVKQTETPELGVVDLVDEGKLICNPKLYPSNPNGCFEEPLNPCPSCTGKCKPTGFNTPCDDSQDACGTCPDIF